MGLKDSSLLENGWVKLPCGLIIQWGKAIGSGVGPGIGYSTIVQINYTIAFPVAALVVIPVGEDDAKFVEGSELSMSLRAKNKTSASINASRVTSNSIGTETFYINWLALGY